MYHPQGKFGGGGLIMWKLVPAGIALAVLGLAGPAVAGDLDVALPAYKAPAPTPPPFSWSGFYVGGELGGHWGSDRISTAADATLPGFGPAGAAALDAASRVTLNPSGFAGGFDAGYNFAGIGGVWGIEVDINFLSGSASRTLTGIAGLPAADALSNTSQASFLSTYRMRWGIPYQRALFYITGGFALETLKTTDTLARVGLPVQSVSNSTTLPGVAAGFGADFALTPNWWIRAEYLFIDLKTQINTIPATPGNFDDIAVSHEYIDNILRFAVNYKLGGSEP
jgi:outer membrane immunogenic protein